MAHTSFTLSVRVLMLAAILGALGCGVGKTPDAVSESLTADQVWNRVRDAYRHARTYRDRGVVRLTYRQDDRPIVDEAEVSLKFARPNKIRVRAYQVQIGGDGQELRTRVLDAATDNLDSQVLAVPASEKLTKAELLGDPLVAAQIGNGVIGRESLRTPLQLDLLLSDPPLGTLGDSLAPRLLEPEKIDGKTYHRLQWKSDDEGEFVAWIDRESFLVRRFEYPTGALLKELVEAPDIRDVRLVADLVDASVNEEIGENLFSLDLPAAPKLVRFFVPPPQRLPSDLFGKRAGEFSFQTLDGGRLQAAELNDKIAVLVWFNDYPACEQTLRSVQQVRDALAPADDVTFLAVCTEPSSTSHQQIRDLLLRWEVALPAVRDLEAHGRDLFRIEGAPTVVVLDRKGVVQVVETGLNPRLAKELPGILGQLRDGQNVAQRVLEQHQQQLRLYARHLQVASQATPSAVVDIPVTPIREKTEPRQMRRTELWANSQTSASVGNLLVVDDSPRRILALSGGRSVLELDESGKTIAQHPLPLPEGFLATFLRTFRGPQGRRLFAVGASLGKQVFLLDEDWKMVLAYPPADQPHDGIRDARLADLNGDGRAELYVAFWGVLGVQQVATEASEGSEAGARNWSNRTMPSVVSLAVSHPDDSEWRKLLLAGEQGRLLPLNHFGNADRLVEVPGWLVHQLHASEFGAAGGYCGLAMTAEQNLVAVALDGDLKEQWNYPLPAGLHRSPIECVASGAIRETKRADWVLAAADGSLHVVSADGEFSDFFHVGEAITGLAVASLDGRPTVIYATAAGVFACRLEMP